VETYLGSLPSRGRTERWADPAIHYPKANVEQRVVGGHEPRSWVWLCFTAAERWSQDAARDALILQTVLRFRIFEVLRRDLAAVYDLRTNVDLQREPTERHFLTVLAACSPQNVDKVRGAVLSELADIARNGVDREHLEKTASQIRKKREVDVKDNEWWLAQLREAYRHDGDFAGALDAEALLARVTSDHIKAAAARMVRNKPHIVISLLPAGSAN
jgi:zinc protease